MMKNNIYKIAIVAPTPFHYHIPFYQKISKMPEIDVTVYYCSDETVRGAEIEKMYLSRGLMAKKEDILQGYRFQFLKNYSLNPSFMNWPFGLINLGIAGELKKHHYDAVIIQSWTNFTWWLIALICFWRRIPLVFMTDSNILGERLKSNFKLRFKQLLLGKFLFKNVSGFLTSGTTNENFYRYYGVPESKIIRMPFSWGYESFLKEFDHIKHNRASSRTHMNIAEKDFVILYVGRFSEEKSPELLLKAFHASNHQNKKLFMVGDGPMRKELEKYVADHHVKGVEFFGFQPKEKLFHFYNVADVLVMPSKRETWGIVVNEAMCFSLPIIASDRIGVAADLVRNNENGFIFEAENIQALKETLEKMMQLSPDEIAELSKNSRLMIEAWVQNYQAENQLKKLLQLLC